MYRMKEGFCEILSDTATVQLEKISILQFLKNFKTEKKNLRRDKNVIHDPAANCRSITIILLSLHSLSGNFATREKKGQCCSYFRLLSQ